MSVYEIVAEKIVAKLEAGVVPWRQPWGSAGFRAPRNVRGTVYRGVNVFLLGSQGYRSPYWLTFRQAKELGGSVRKGERSTPVVFWKWIEKDETSSTGEVRKVSVPLLRYYNVFNVEQTEGLPAKWYELPSGNEPTFSPIEACEEIVSGYEDRPAISHGGSRAYYAPSLDSVTVPAREAFETPAYYYATLFHELGHSTGHGKRLGRDGITDPIMFGSHQYSREELVAEMTAAFLSGRAGIDSEPLLENSAAYLASWIRVLRGSPKLAVIAAAQAQKAADWILGERRDADGKDSASRAGDEVQQAAA